MVRDRKRFCVSLLVDSKKKNLHVTVWSVLIVSFLLKRGSMVFYDYRRFVCKCPIPLSIHPSIYICMLYYVFWCVRSIFDFMAKCNKFYWFVDVCDETNSMYGTLYTCYCINIYVDVEYFLEIFFNGWVHNVFLSWNWSELTSSTEIAFSLRS